MWTNGRFAIAVLLVYVSALGAHVLADGSRRPSLKAMARELGGKATATSDAQIPSATVETLAETAEIIVQGRVAKITSRLSADESMIWTDVTLRSDARFVKDTIGGREARRPGPSPSLTFFEPGGTVRLDGLEMTFQSNLSADPALEVGDEVIAFLARSEEPRGLRVRNGPYGLLRVQGRRVSSANKEFARRNHLGSDSLEELYRRLQEAVGAKQ